MTPYCEWALIEPTSGHIYVEGALIGQKVVNGRTMHLSDCELARERTEIGFVFQRFNLFPHLISLEKVSHPARSLVRAEKKQNSEVEKCWKKWGLVTSSSSIPIDCTGGQQQRAAAVIDLALYGGAILAEVFRAGIQALHLGQREAALSLGMTPAMSMHYILIPQAMRVILPPVGNYAIGLLNHTAVCALIAAPELMLQAKDLASSKLRADGGVSPGCSLLLLHELPSISGCPLLGTAHASLTPSA